MLEKNKDVSIREKESQEVHGKIKSMQRDENYFSTNRKITSYANYYVSKEKRSFGKSHLCLTGEF